jgi:hypothetical protein
VGVALCKMRIVLAYARGLENTAADVGPNCLGPSLAYARGREYHSRPATLPTK